MKQYHKNPRKISKAKFARLQDTLRRLGDLSGIVHDLNSDEIIGGNQRGRVFDVDKCDVVLVDGPNEPDEQGTVAHGYVVWEGKRYAYRQVRWTSAQCEEANITANLGGGEWDFTELANWEAPKLVDWGFDAETLKDWKLNLAGLGELLESEKPPKADAEPQTDRAEELRKKWGVELGQLWRLPSRTPGQEHRLVCGDCTDAAVVERVMMGERAGAVVTDPPYGIDKGKVEGDEDLRVWAASMDATNALMKDESFYCCFVSVEKMLDAGDIVRRYFDYRWQVIQYVNNGMVRGGVGFSVFMAVLIFAKGNAKARNLIRDVRETSNSSQKAAKRMHPYEKDLIFVSDIIEYATRDGDFVYDPFSGSGTTIIAAENLSRQCRAIEISPAYVAVALQRYQQAFGITPELISPITTNG